MSEEIQARVARVFAHFLEIPTVTAEDDLFQLGGDSFVAVQVALELERVFGIEVPLDALENASTVRGIAAWIAVHRNPSSGSFAGGSAASDPLL